MKFFAGIAQLVERNLAKVEVAGSNPVSRSSSTRSGKCKTGFEVSRVVRQQAVSCSGFPQLRLGDRVVM